MTRTEDSIAAREAKTRETNKARILAARPVSKAAQVADKKAQPPRSRSGTEGL